MSITSSLIIGLCIFIGIILMLFFTFIYLVVSVIKMKRRINKFLPEDKNMDIEKMLCEYVKIVLDVLVKEDKLLENIDSTRKDLNQNINTINNQLKSIIEENKTDLQQKIDLINNQLKFAIQKVGFIRYNPFDEVGGELCYVVAFLDDNNNGVVINSIYSRENCYSYAKDITNGKSLNHKLSQEEIKAIKLAMEK